MDEDIRRAAIRSYRRNRVIGVLGATLLAWFFMQGSGAYRPLVGDVAFQWIFFTGCFASLLIPVILVEWVLLRNPYLWFIRLKRTLPDGSRGF